jgi:hypothetical protein
MQEKIQLALIGMLTVLFVLLIGLTRHPVSGSQEEPIENISTIFPLDSVNKNNEAAENVEHKKTLTGQIQGTPSSDAAAETNSISWFSATEPNVVLDQLRKLATMQANNLQGQAGWLNITISGPDIDMPKNYETNATVYHGPDGQMVASAALYPEGQGLVSRWYYVNQNGLVEQGFTYISDANNQVYQRTILQQGIWKNVTLRENNFPEVVYAMPAVSNQIEQYLPVQEVIQFLEVSLLTESEFETISVNAYEEHGRYHLSVTTIFAAPVDLGHPIPEPVAGGERHFIFDITSGHLLTDIHQFTLQSGETILAGTAEYYTSPMFSQLPENIQQLLEEIMDILE